MRHGLGITAAAIACAALFTATVASAAPDGARFEISPTGTSALRAGYYPAQVPFETAKPVGVKKEPAYKAAPKYALIRLGNGPKAATIVALDEPGDADWRIYVDANHNGDLTDDGDGAWSKKTEPGDRQMYGVNQVELRASYGTATRETSTARYTVALYRFVKAPYLLLYRVSSREGKLTVDGATHRAMLVENDAKALFDTKAATKEDAAKSKPVWLFVDLKDDGKFASGPIDIRAPFKLNDKAYEATVSPDGSRVAIEITTKPVVELTPKPAPRPPLLKAGTPAPDFTAEKWGGGQLKLSDYRGKVVIVDFWATWCGPCQRSMPHVEKVFKAVKDQGVVVLGVCVWDEKSAYEKWVPENQSKYTFQFAFDPAGRGANGIAGKLFNVSGIPTTYIIDKDGNVADSIVGFSDGDVRVEEALKKLGIEAK